MAKDVVPELLDKIEKQFDSKVKKDKQIIALLEKLKGGNVTYAEAHDYARKIGEILAETYQINLSSEILPDGRMYYNIGDRVVGTTLTNNYELVVDYTDEVQNLLNEEAGLGIKARSPELNQDKIDGIINRLDSEPIFDEVKWILDEPIKNFTQSIVDDAVESNAKFHKGLGMKPKIVRKTLDWCCDWCQNLIGEYDYPAPKEVYQRHDYCNCIIEYYPGDGKIQNVRTKGWR